MAWVFISCVAMHVLRGGLLCACVSGRLVCAHLACGTGAISVGRARVSSRIGRRLLAFREYVGQGVSHPVSEPRPSVLGCWEGG